MADRVRTLQQVVKLLDKANALLDDARALDESSQVFAAKVAVIRRMDRLRNAPPKRKRKK